MIKLGIRFSDFCSEKLINFEFSSQIYIKLKKLDHLLKNLHFFHAQKSINLMKKIVKMLLVAMFFLCYLYWQYFFLLQRAPNSHLFLRMFFFSVYFCLFGRFNSLESDFCFNRYDNLR